MLKKEIRKLRKRPEAFVAPPTGLLGLKEKSSPGCILTHAGSEAVHPTDTWEVHYEALHVLALQKPFMCVCVRVCLYVYVSL